MRTLPIVERSRMERLLAAFQRSTGLGAIVVNVSGDTILQPATGQQSSFCRLIGATPSGREKCRQCYAAATATAHQLDEPYVFRCHAGLVCWAVPVTGGDEPAAVICNQVMMWEPDDLLWSEVAGFTGLRREDCEPLMEAALELQRVEPQRVQAAAELLLAIVNSIAPRPAAAEGAWAPAPPHALLRQEARVSAAVEHASAVAPAPQRLLEREGLLLQRIRLRDAEGAASVLADLVADLQADLAPRQAGARALELLVLISRAVIDAGGDQHSVLAASASYAERVRIAVDAAVACAAVTEALAAFIATLRPAAGGARHQLLLRVMAFLRENFHRQDLTLERIARVVHLSPAYLSHLFSKELNMTMTQYLTGVRLEAARALLRDTEMSVSELAMQVGYDDPGYFCKIFKKYMKTSPGAYRQQFRRRVAVSQ